MHAFELHHRYVAIDEVHFIKEKADTMRNFFKENPLKGQSTKIAKMTKM